MADRLVISVFYEKTETIHLALALTEHQQETLKSVGADLEDPRSIFEHLLADTANGGDRLIAGGSRVQTALTEHRYKSGNLMHMSPRKL